MADLHSEFTSMTLYMPLYRWNMFSRDYCYLSVFINANIVSMSRLIIIMKLNIQFITYKFEIFNQHENDIFQLSNNGSNSCRFQEVMFFFIFLFVCNVFCCLHPSMLNMTIQLLLMSATNRLANKQSHWKVNDSGQ